MAIDLLFGITYHNRANNPHCLMAVPEDFLHYLMTPGNADLGRMSELYRRKGVSGNLLNQIRYLPTILVNVSGKIN